MASESPVAPNGSTITGEHTSETTTILTLPPELRNAIYEFAIVETRPVSIISIKPGLTQTSRQLRIESLSIYLQRNTFKANARAWPDMDNLNQWLAPLEAEHARQITRLCIDRTDCWSIAQTRAFRYVVELIRRLKQAGIPARAITWCKPRSDSSFSTSWAGYQVSRESVIDPLLRLHEYAHNVEKPGYYLHQQRESYRARLVAAVRRCRTGVCRKQH